MVTRRLLTSAPTGRQPVRARPVTARPASGALAAQLSLAQARLEGPTKAPFPPIKPRQTAPAATQDKPRSLGEQLGGAVHNVIPGIAGMVKAGLVQAFAPARLAYDVSLGGGLRRDPNLSGFQAYAQEYAPAITGFATSMGHTGQRVGSPTTLVGSYRQASDEGRVVDVALEDAANLSLGAEAVGAGFGGRGGALIPEATAAERDILAPAAARAGGAAVAEDVAKGAGRASEVRPFSSVTDLRPAAEAAEPVYASRRGLAAVAEKAGMERTASALQTTGKGFIKAAHLGSEVAGAPILPYRLVGRAGSAALDVINDFLKSRNMTTIPRPDAAIRAVLEKVAPQLTFGQSARGRELARIEAEAHASTTAAVRDALKAGVLAEKLGLTQEQGAAVLNSLDYPEMMSEIRDMPVEAIPDYLNRRYERAGPSVPSSQRLTPEAVQVMRDYAAGNLPQKTLDRMNEVRDTFQMIAQERTVKGLNMQESAFNPATGQREYVGKGPLNPEQVGQEPLTFQVARVRGVQERARDIVQRQWEGAEPRTVRQERIANAHEAIAAQLPPPPSEAAAQAFEVGVRKGKASIRDAAARAEHRTTLNRLEKAVNEYQALAEDAPVARVKELGDQIDRLTDRARQIEEYVAGARIRPEPAVPRGELTDLRRRAKEISAQQAEQVRGEIDQMTGGARPGLPARGQTGGEWDWWRNQDWLDPKTRGRLRREGWIAKPGLGDTPDNFANSMSSVYGRELTVDEAMHRYVETVQRLWDEQSGRGDATVANLAYERGMSPEQVAAGLRGGLAGYARIATTTADAALTDLRDEFGRFTPDEQASFNAVADAMLGDPAAGWSDFTELLDSYIPGANTEALVRDLGSTVPIRDVVDWMRTGETTPALQAAAERVRQAAAAEASARPLPGPKLSEIMAPTSKGDPWKRHTGTTSTGETTNPLSPAERTQIRAAVERDRANQMRAEQVRRRRSINVRNERIADLNTELGRRFQDRLVEDVNRPAIVRVRNKVDRSAPTLGGIVGEGDGRVLTGLTNQLARRYGAYEDLIDALDGTQRKLSAVTAQGVAMGTPAETIGQAIKDVLATKQPPVILDPADLTALNDAIGKGTLLERIDQQVSADAATGTRLNTPYRVEQLVHESAWNMPDDTLTAIKADMVRYDSARTRTIQQVMNDQTAVMPARYRTIAQGNQRSVGALIDMAEAYNKQSPGSGNIFLEQAETTTTTLADMVEAGIDPVHLTGGQEAARGSLSASRLTGERKTRATQQRRTGLRPTSIKGYAGLEAAEARKYELNVRDNAVMEAFGKRADSIPEVRAAIDDWAARRNGEVMAAEDIAKAAADTGYVPLSGNRANPDTVLVPEQVARELNRALPTNTLIRGLRQANRVWKQWILPFSAKWIVGNIIGNVLMAQFNANVSPVELARQMRRIAKDEGGLRRWWENQGLSRAAPPELANYGLTHQERQLWSDYMEQPARTRGGRVIRRAARWSYDLNEFVDNASRSAVFLAQRERGATRQAALRASLKAMGDFTRMSPTERRYVREVFPFYAWLRHSLTMTLRLPVQDPMRAAVLLNLTRIFADPDTKDDFLARFGAIPVAGGFLEVGNVSPFFDFRTNPAASQNYAGGMSPFIKTPIALGAGWDINTMKPLGRPTGTAIVDESGRPATTPPIARLFTDPLRGLGEIGYVATSAAPAPIKSIRDIALGNERRWQTGYQVGRKTKPDYNRLSLIMRGLNLPSYTPSSGG